MRKLGFTAEASLYRSSVYYCAVDSSRFEARSGQDVITLASGEACSGRGASTCSQLPSPQICVYGRCHPCVPSGEECRLYGTQLCCRWDQTCVFDVNDEKVKCGISG